MDIRNTEDMDIVRSMEVMEVIRNIDMEGMEVIRNIDMVATEDTRNIDMEGMEVIRNIDMVDMDIRNMVMVMASNSIVSTSNAHQSNFYSTSW